MKKGEGKKVVGLLAIIAIAIAVIVWQATRPEPKLPPWEKPLPPGTAPQDHAGRAIGPVPLDTEESSSPSRPEEKPKPKSR